MLSKYYKYFGVGKQWETLKLELALTHNCLLQKNNLVPASLALMKTWNHHSPPYYCYLVHPKRTALNAKVIMLLEVLDLRTYNRGGYLNYPYSTAIDVTQPAHFGNELYTPFIFGNSYKSGELKDIWSLDSFSTSSGDKAKAAVQVQKSGKPIFGAKYNVIHNIVAWRCRVVMHPYILIRTKTILVTLFALEETIGKSLN
ncbi:hypothetical protein PROFUN_13123 [Planoprotostelium fungivorum]|uniref:Uncharacterized protein n=1 Tax=Planoprotostelium fungivorum TaxID=1890364 RepID=A0A2P6N519_9EUKA|nr:hypothetical protein PROFUN_13123 [Planoprotostelium fungivorum]